MDNDAILYSVNTIAAYRVQSTYYNDMHYVWCSTKYDFGRFQPASSNPLTIAQMYLQDVFSQDRHSAIIKQNRNGIKRGAMFKRREGIIDEHAESEILKFIKCAGLEFFLPLLYVIPYAKVASICEPVPPHEKAAYHSIEYRIKNLPRNAFELVDLGRTVPTIFGGEIH